MGKNKMIKLVDLITEDRTTDDADRWVAFLQSKLNLDNLKQEFKASIRSEEDYATDYYNVIDQIANEDIE
tara:strand:+ start:286 stop:495 length:210 start_codon:yes stop_codon:yes gene_type:complete